jgi:hypothetical protein
MSKTFLFLDDDAFQPEGIRNPEKYYPLIGRDDLLTIMQTFDTIVKFTNVEDATDYILNNGCPNFISFDNDLQRELEGRHLAKWLTDQDIDSGFSFFPDDFNWFIHSQNPIASKAINGLLVPYMEYRKSAFSNT